MSLSTELCVKAPTGMCFHGSVSPKQPGPGMCTNPQCLRLVTVCLSLCGSFKEQYWKKLHRSCFAVKAWPSRWAAGLGKRLSEILKSVFVKLITLWFKKESQSGVECCVNFAFCLYLNKNKNTVQLKKKMLQQLITNYLKWVGKKTHYRDRSSKKKKRQRKITELKDTITKIA